jgi:predicted RNA methylase
LNKRTEDNFAALIDQYDDLKFALLEAQTFDPVHFGFPPLYYQVMESDQERVGAFRQAFAQHDFRNMVVCEAGVGRLALTQYYLPFVKHAYLIEHNPDLRAGIEAMIAQNNWQDKVTLLFADARTVELPEPIDALIGEMMSIFCANEYQVQVFQHLRHYLRPEGTLFPQRIINLAQLAQVDFSEAPDHYPINFVRHLPTVLSSQVVVNTITLMTEIAQEVHIHEPVTALLSGEVNALCLRSFVEISPGINFTGTDSLMPPTVLKLAHPTAVSAGATYQLKGHFKYGTSLHDAVFWLE